MFACCEVTEEAVIPEQFETAVIPVGSYADVYKRQELEEAVQALTDACIQSYQDAVSVPYITEISHYVQKGYELARLTLIVLIVVIVVIAAVLFFMHSWKHRALRYYIYALSGSALMIIMLPVIVFLSGKVQDVYKRQIYTPVLIDRRPEALGDHHCLLEVNLCFVHSDLAKVHSGKLCFPQVRLGQTRVLQ